MHSSSNWLVWNSPTSLDPRVVHRWKRYQKCCELQSPKCSLLKRNCLGVSGTTEKSLVWSYSRSQMSAHQFGRKFHLGQRQHQHCNPFRFSLGWVVSDLHAYHEQCNPNQENQQPSIPHTLLCPPSLPLTTVVYYSLFPVAHLQNLFHKKHCLYIAAKQLSTNSARSRYETFQNHVTLALRSAKSGFYQSLSSKINIPREFWKSLLPRPVICLLISISTTILNLHP